MTTYHLRSADGIEVFTGTITPPPGGGSNPVSIATAYLTNAQLIALQTTPIQLVATPGSGKTLIPLVAYFVCDTTHGAYTNIDNAAAFGIDSAGAGSPSGLLAALAEGNGGNGTVSGLLAFGGPTAATLGPNASIAIVPDGSVYGDYGFGDGTDNQPLVIKLVNGGSDLTGGDSRNFMRVICVYATATTPVAP